MARLLKLVLALVAVVGLLYYLQSRAGEKPQTRMEQAVTLDDLK